MIPKLSEQQLQALWWLAELDPLRYDVISRVDTKDNTKEYFEKCLGILGLNREQLKAIMPEARLARRYGVDTFQQKLGSQSDKPVVPWNEKFRTLGQLETGPLKMLVEGFVPWGITGIGSLSGVAKTWFGLSLSRALTLGKPFLGVYSVPKTHKVLYLIPEMGDRSFRLRAEKMGLPDDERFRCTTVQDGRIALNDSSLITCIKETKPVVFLDTLVRFNGAGDENSAQQNAKLMANALFDFLTWGAPGVFFMHHSPKYAADAETMTLENAFRGTGDLGAMCDAAYGLCTDKQKADNGRDWDHEYFAESKRLTRVMVKCVKPRDFQGPESFVIQGRPYIDQRGDFAVITQIDRAPIEERVMEAITENVAIKPGALRSKFGIGLARLTRIAKDGGFVWKDEKYWQPILQEPTKEDDVESALKF